MAKNKTYPVLHVTSVKGSTYKHCSINPTLYFKINIDEQRAKEDQMYSEYMEQIQKEALDAITNKFLTSIPIVVTNDHIPFLIFKDNVDLDVVKLFCKAILDELTFTTKTRHTADYTELKTMLMQMDKDPSPFKVSKVGEKLTHTNIVQETIETLHGDGKDQDAGILTPFDVFITFKERKNKLVEDETREEVVVSW